MITYTFKANSEFYVFKDTFQDVYAVTGSKIREIEKRGNVPVDKTTYQTIETINGEDYWCLVYYWHDIQCFRDSVKIFAEHCTDEMIDYLNTHPVVRYIVIKDENDNILFPETQIPNLNGQAYIDWVDNILAQ